MITFTVSGQPIPKARPRVWQGVAHTPERTKAWEEQVAWAALAERVEVHTGDLRVGLHFRRSKFARADLDNLIKAVLDGLNGIAYADDKQVVEVHAMVVYGSDDPGVTITIEERD